MPTPNTIPAWIDFLNAMIAALENGQIAVESLAGKTLPEMAEISEAGWDNFDAAIAEAKNTD